MARETSWDDEEIYKQSSGERLERYKADQKRRDVIRVISSPYQFGMHWLQTKGYYVNCGIDEDGAGTCLVCNDTDEDGKPRIPVSVKFGCLVVHIASKKGKGDWESIQEIKFWGFGRDKYKALFELREDHGDIRKLDLIVACVDSQMQKLNISPTGKDTKVDAEAVKPQIENGKKWLKIYIQTPTLEEQKRALGDDGDFDFGANKSDDEDGPSDSATDEPTDSIEDEVDGILDGIDGIG